MNDTAHGSLGVVTFSTTLLVVFHAHCIARAYGSDALPMLAISSQICASLVAHDAFPHRLSNVPHHSIIDAISATIHIGSSVIVWAILSNDQYLSHNDHRTWSAIASSVSSISATFLRIPHFLFVLSSATAYFSSLSSTNNHTVFFTAFATVPLDILTSHFMTSGKSIHIFATSDTTFAVDHGILAYILPTFGAHASFCLSRFTNGSNLQNFGSQNIAVSSIAPGIPFNAVFGHCTSHCIDCSCCFRISRSCASVYLFASSPKSLLIHRTISSCCMVSDTCCSGSGILKYSVNCGFTSRYLLTSSSSWSAFFSGFSALSFPTSSFLLSIATYHSCGFFVGITGACCSGACGAPTFCPMYSVCNGIGMSYIWKLVGDVCVIAFVDPGMCGIIFGTNGFSGITGAGSNFGHHTSCLPGIGLVSAILFTGVTLITGFDKLEMIV